MGFFAEGNFTVAAYKKETIIFWYRGITGNKLVSETAIPQKALIRVKEDTDSLGIFCFTHSFITKLLEDYKIDGVIDGIYRSDTMGFENDHPSHFTSINIKGDISDNTEETKVEKLSEKVTVIFMQGINYQAKGINLISLSKENSTWNILESKFCVGGRKKQIKNLKIDVTPKTNLLGLDQYVKDIQIIDFFSKLKIKEISIIDDNSIGVIKEDKSCTIYSVNEENISSFSKEEQLLFKGFYLLAGKIEKENTKD